MRLIDLELVVIIVKKKDIKVIIDHTFSTPYLQKPLKIGCDSVIHNAIKYIGGHGGTVSGIVVGDTYSHCNKPWRWGNTYFSAQLQ